MQRYRPAPAPKSHLYMGTLWLAIVASLFFAPPLAVVLFVLFIREALKR